VSDGIDDLNARQVADGDDVARVVEARAAVDEVVTGNALGEVLSDRYLSAEIPRWNNTNDFRAARLFLP